MKNVKIHDTEKIVASEIVDILKKHNLKPQLNLFDEILVSKITGKALTDIEEVSLKYKVNACIDIIKPNGKFVFIIKISKNKCKENYFKT